MILFGEHAVVYGRPALAVPVTQVHADVEVSNASRRGIWIDAPNINVHAELNTFPSDHPIAAAIHNFLFLSHVSPFPNLEIKITSTIPVASGLGSGAAVTVALVRALASHLNHPLTDEEVNVFTYEIEKLHHGTPSGIDNSVVTYAKPIYFIKGQPMEALRVGQPFTVVIGDTGVPASTKESVQSVRRLWINDKARWESVFDKIGEVSFTARRALEAGKSEMLGELMDENHVLLQKLTVSSQELDHLVQAAKAAGATGAKLSGGGRGGNMIALVQPDVAEDVSLSLQEAGARITIITEVS